MTQYHFGDKSRRILKDTVRRVRGGKLSSRPTPTRRAPRGGSVTTLRRVLLTETVSAATYAAGVLTPVECTVYPWKKVSAGSSDATWSEDNSFTALNYYASPIPVDEGKGRIAYVSGNELLIADCTQIELE